MATDYVPGMPVGLLLMRAHGKPNKGADASNFRSDFAVQLDGLAGAVGNSNFRCRAVADIVAVDIARSPARR